MNNGFDPTYGVDLSSLHLFLDPLVLLEEKEKEKIEKRNSRKLFSSSVVTEFSELNSEDSEDISVLFEPKFRYIRHKKTKVILKRIRF